MRTFTAFPALAAVLLLAGCSSSGTATNGGKSSVGTNAAGSIGGAGGAGGSTATTGASTTTGNTTATTTGNTSSTAGTTAGSTSGCGLRTCASANADCGPIGDGCGGVIDCGTCGPHDYCGGGGPSRCGPTPCVPTSCQAEGKNCGVISDGCGGTLDCGSCQAGESCGTAGPNVCGGAGGSGGTTGSSCVPRDCSQAGATCGPVADGCGGLTADCGTCQSPDICGGGGVPSQCGSSNRPDGGLACTGLCLQQVSCPGGATTSITGKVYAPNGLDPLYNALVYVPNGPVQAFTPGVACLTCEQQVSGSPLVSATTGPDGSFTLSNMPVGSNIPLVIQLGRWRRQVTISNVPQCTSTALPATLTRLPKNQAEGDIPLTAMVTGSVDALECVLRKIGIDDAEFTNPGGTGRIRFYKAPTESGGSGPGATINNSTPDGTQLVGSSTELAKYDLVLLSCEGSPYAKANAHLDNLKAYADVGGRVYATHYSYTWLQPTRTWNAAANWDLDHDQGTSDVGTVDQSFPKGSAFSSWLDNVGASTSPGSGQINIAEWRWDVDSVKPPTQQWIYLNRAGSQPVQHMTFNTPFGAPADQQCGRVLFSDFHVTNAATDPTIHFPSECTNGAMTAQEHILEFMLFDLASCITPDNGPPPVCNPLTSCPSNTCGPIADGCGGVLQCGGCPTGQSCGGGGVASQCGSPSCTPQSCQQQGVFCGPAGDGCGGTIDCGGCTGSELCGGGGTQNQCGTPPTCTPTTCAAEGAQCGAIADGCGGILQCGGCPSGQTCGGSGVANTCGGLR